MKARFTLIEFMTVIAIIVVLLGIGMGAYRYAKNRSCEVQTLAMMTAISQALEDIQETYGFTPVSNGFEPVVITLSGKIPVKIAFSSSGLPGSYLAPAPSGATPTVMNQAYERFIKHLDLLLVLECLDESGRLVDHWGNVIYYSNPGKLNPSGFDMVSAGSDLAFGSSRQAVPPENRTDYEVDGKLVCDDVVFL